MALSVLGTGCVDQQEPPAIDEQISVQENEADTEAADALPIDPSDGGSVAERLRDVSLAANVKLILSEEAGVDISKIDLHVQNGRVTLQGDVASQEIRDRVANATQRVDGVQQVVNQLNAPNAPAPAQTQATRPDTAQTPSTETKAPPQQQTETPAATYYTVKRGDNLGAIARRHGTTVAELQQLNNIRGTNIRAGQKLRVK